MKKKNLTNLRFKISITRDYNKNIDKNNLSAEILTRILKRNKIQDLSEKEDILIESVVMEYETILHETKKEILKNVTNFLRLFNNNEDFFIYFKFEGSVFGFIKQYNTRELKENLEKKYPDGFYKINDDILQFNFNSTKKDIYSLFVQLNFFD